MNVSDYDYESFPAHTRIFDEDILAVYVELTVNGEYALLPYEEDWRERGPLISASGYQLRRRYDIDWTPSWEDTNLNPFYCEDSIDSSTPNVMDAIRLSDGLPVAIKATLGWTTEASIAFLFTDGGAVEEARNHCVPILDTFIDEDIVYIVMPLLRPFNDPPFLAVAEVIDFIGQLIEGIEYMHQQNVAHRDITVGNIMMDASELYPEGFHPVRQNLSRNGMAEVVGVTRTHAPVHYYLIDFDAAIAFEKGTPTSHKYAEGKAGRDDEVPEFKLGEPYDPFKVDIFQFGNLLKKEFLQKYTGVEFLEPLVREMTRPRPGERPSATSLRVRFNTVRNRLRPTQMRTHLNLKDATDPFRDRLLQLGIESLLDGDSDDFPEQSSSKAPIKPLVPCLTVAYILARRILSSARSSRIFPMQKVHLARQTMHLLILFNTSLDIGTGLSSEQEEERISLEDELRDFEKILKHLDDLASVKLDGTLMLRKFHKQFFRQRPYFESARDVETDIIYPKLEAYDLRTLEIMECQTANNYLAATSPEIPVGDSVVSNSSSGSLALYKSPLPTSTSMTSGLDASYSFTSLPGNIVGKRPRRKFEEITRNYICIWPGCSKAYGTLNHLNDHVTMQKHGAKRAPSEFMGPGKVWRKQKREQQQQQQHHHQHDYGAQIDEDSEFYPDEDGENAAEDDEGSVYNPTEESTQ